MPECPECSTPHQEGDRYCNQCGQRLFDADQMASGARTQKSLDLVDVHFNLGLVYFKKGQHRQALETWEKALARDPGNQLLEEHVARAKASLQENS
jgi:Tfp pilus assembly protein PilF